MNVKGAKLPELLSKVGKFVYVDSEDLPEEEKRSIQAKLRNRSSDAISWAAEALGSIDPRDIKWALGKARASLFAIEATYKHACDIGSLELNPDIMVAIQQAVKEIDSLIDKATAGIPEWLSEMEPPQKESKK